MCCMMRGVGEALKDLFEWRGVLSGEGGGGGVDSRRSGVEVFMRWKSQRMLSDHGQIGLARVHQEFGF